ncbi:MAG: dipeptidyl aminopeptidase/acylaminoacyl peptidase [Enterobacterales bacterium]|jgi:dipeptidyl aminopeptidase/acylaminoacyl peptidase
MSLKKPHSMGLILTIALLCLNINAKEEVNQKLLSYEDIFNLEYAASPQISADGKTIVYERRAFDIMTDGTRTNIWQIDVNGKNHRPLLSGKASYRMPRFSPDGKKLAYVSAIEGKSQLYIRWIDTAQTARVTDLQNSPANISWSPDGKWLAFSMFKPEPPKTIFKEMPKKPKEAKWAGTAKYVDRTNYRSNGQGFLPRGYSHIYVVPTTGGTARQVTEGSYHHNGTINWSKDSRRIIISADFNTDWELRPLESDIYEIDIADGSVKNLVEREGPDFSPIISPDGKKIAYLRFDDRKLSSQNAHLFVMSTDGKNSIDLTPTLDRGVGDLQWAANGKGVYFTYDDQGKKRLAYVSLKGKQRNLKASLGGQSLGRPYTSGEYHALANGSVVYTASDTQRPADLSLLSKSGKTRRLTQLNEDLMAHKDMASVEAMTVKSKVDGRDIEAWIALPPNFDATKKYPLILEIHGGPHATYGPHYSTEIQLMAAKGYVVVWSNPRGSTSYGEEFANLIHHNYPSSDYDDLMDVVDAVIAKNYVDPEQLFVTGGSGGGVLTAWIVGKTDRFKAAVVAKPVINWISFSLTADGYAYFTKYWMPGMPWDNVEHLWKHSPLSLVGNVKTPTMLITGEVDYRTPMSETEQYYQALKLQNVDTAMVRVVKAHHGIAARPSNLIQKVGNILTWFEKYKPVKE